MGSSTVGVSGREGGSTRGPPGGRGSGESWESWRRPSTGGTGGKASSGLREPGESECLSERADHLLLHQENLLAAIISGGSHQEDPANPAARPLSSSSSYAQAKSSSTGSPTSKELKELKIIQKNLQAKQRQ